MSAQSSRLEWLIKYLLSESPKYSDIRIPDEESERRRLFRSLVNVRPPMPVSDEFLKIQDKYLKQTLSERGITDVSSLTPIAQGLCVWQGDITRLRCDAIVNAANDALLGCFSPCHSCIDNCIHTFSGVQLRLACNDIMLAQGHPEPTGQAKITPAFNLPCKYVLHTVGPIVYGALTNEHEELLASSYRSCFKLAEENRCESIAFCCISTGVFRFPNLRAAEIAVSEVRKCLSSGTVVKKAVFNVFKDIDRDIYMQILNNHH